MAAAVASVLLPGACVAVAFVDADGVEQRGRLDALWSERFEYALPVREFGSFKGQRSFQGAWWFATTGEHVRFESWVERDAVMLLDFDAEVVAVSAQPFWLSWADERGTRRHAPDFFARLVDGSAVVIDVRPDERVRDEDVEVFAFTERVCAGVGWGYRRVGVADPVLLANVRWLSGYRHRRCLTLATASVLLQRLALGPMQVGDLVASVGDRAAVLPTLYHLMWRRVVDADVVAAPLSDRTVVLSGRGSA